ncbi:D-beta-hydroxybutyrate dehydrogenase, mitochondrial [Armadillidium nasatum]|uniref:D-beta-hydroxybutyrate dehydrogenase, mitochondrial n=1 Tax=Armadillidium nasatum TaxID=96803 RepID=A0A5N5TAZ7_9CRUS|nr:D-beta-hydroxybutyrate dehydrogenase, mitochondrial [Armadillidium nasatum]
MGNKMIEELQSIKPLTVKVSEALDQFKQKFSSNLSEKRIVMRWYWIVAIWICVWMTLIFLAQSSRAVLWISVGLLAVHITHWIQQGIRNAVKKTLIKNTEGKAVFITGCDTGFGHQLAVRLDKLGFKVYAGCLFPEGEGAKLLKEETSERVKVIRIDVTNDDTIQKAYKRVKTDLDESQGRLWALVNNAGIATVTEIEWCPLEVYRKVFDVNSLGLIRVTKTFLPLVRQHEGNRIIIVASLAGRYTFPGFSAYSMSKHAAVSFADGLRLEMRKWNVFRSHRTPIADCNIIQNNLDKLWKECPEEIRKSYGTEYLEDFKNTLHQHMQKAKPLNKIHEVVDDMVHAVAGEEPQCRYVPSLKTQLNDQNIIV